MSRVASTTPPDGAQIPERHPLSPTTGSHITAEFVVTENHQGAPGLAHGGLLSLAFDEALGKLMWLLRAPAVTARLETDFLKPVPIGTKLYITARITGQVNRKVYSEAEGRLGGPDGEVAVRAASLFVIVPMKHFLENAPAEYMEALRKNPELLSFVDPEFDINP